MTLVLGPIAAAMLGLALPFKISNILAKVGSGNAALVTFHDFLLLGLFAMCGVICNRISFRFLLSSQARTLERTQNEILDNLLTKSSTFFDNQMSGKLTSDVFSITDAQMQLQDILAINVMPFLVNIIGGIIIVGINSPLMAIILAVMTITVIGTAYLSSYHRRNDRIERHEAQRKLRGYFADIITNNSTVRLFARESYEARQHGRLNNKLKDLRIKDWLKVTNDGNNRILVVTAIQIGFIAYVVSAVKSNPALLTAGIFSFSFSLALSNKMFEINGMIRGYENAITNAAPIVAILQEPASVLDPATPMPFEVPKGNIVFKDVTFRYNNQSTTPLLKNLNLNIEPGEKVGLVGPSGGGKTTITKLVLRLMDIQYGSISIDGIDITKIRQQDLRRNVSYVPQEPLLFHRTIKKNIAYGNPLSSESTIVRAAKQAHADEFITKLKDGYETVVGERGVKLSGGQRQRVAIARAMLKNAPILILDEATSALDSESELYIQEALWRLMENKTSIVIAHRLSTIQKMDRIIVLDDGGIVEEGTHAQLIKSKGMYAKLWKHQSGGFLQESI